MTLSVAVQHHPRRAELLPALLDSLRPLDVDVVADPEPLEPASPWRTYRHALENHHAGVTHLLVIQDDAVVCRDFAATVDRAVAARPDTLSVLCVCGRPQQAASAVLRAGRLGLSWAPIRAQWVPTIALVWPAALIVSALEYVAAQSWPPRFCADDEIVGRIVQGLGWRVYATVPSLVQHEDVVPSLIGRRAAGGRDKGRVAVCFMQDECEPSSIDWSLGAG